MPGEASALNLDHMSKSDLLTLIFNFASERGWTRE